MGFLASMSGHRYESIHIDKHNGATSTKSSWLLPLLAILLSASSFFSGYIVGHKSRHLPYGHIPINSIDLAFKYNRTYTLPPTNETNAAWNDIFPNGAGFVQHPTLAPNTSGIAIFHQLHCLNQIRIGYYNTNRTLSDEIDPDFPDQPAHTRHCFDYLRQSLMCAADSNIEPVNSKLGGVTGWGNMRVCRRFDEVVEWAEKWKSGENQGSGLGV